MEVVNEKITVAQTEYNEGCKTLDENLVKDKAKLADKKVEEIFGGLSE